MMSTIIKTGSRRKEPRGSAPALRGFTLVETLIYAAGTVLLLAVIVTAIYYADNWYGVATISPRVDQTGVSLADRLMGDIRAASSTNSASSAFNSPNGALSLNVMTSSATSAIRRYAIAGGRVTYSENGAAASYLTPANVYVSGLTFSQITTPVSSAVHFTLRLDFSARNGTTTNTYSGAGIMRNTYK